jgi:hypothetical protein
MAENKRDLRQLVTQPVEEQVPVEQPGGFPFVQAGLGGLGATLGAGELYSNVVNDKSILDRGRSAGNLVKQVAGGTAYTDATGGRRTAGGLRGIGSDIARKFNDGLNTSNFINNRRTPVANSNAELIAKNNAQLREFAIADDNKRIADLTQRTFGGKSPAGGPVLTREATKDALKVEGERRPGNTASSKLVSASENVNKVHASKQFYGVNDIDSAGNPFDQVEADAKKLRRLETGQVNNRGQKITGQSSMFLAEKIKVERDTFLKSVRDRGINNYNLSTAEVDNAIDKLKNNASGTITGDDIKDLDSTLFARAKQLKTIERTRGNKLNNADDATQRKAYNQQLEAEVADNVEAARVKHNADALEGKSEFDTPDAAMEDARTRTLAEQAPLREDLDVDTDAPDGDGTTRESKTPEGKKKTKSRLKRLGVGAGLAALIEPLISAPANISREGTYEGLKTTARDATLGTLEGIAGLTTQGAEDAANPEVQGTEHGSLIASGFGQAGLGMGQSLVNAIDSGSEFISEAFTPGVTSNLSESVDDGEFKFDALRRLSESMGRGSENLQGFSEDIRTGGGGDNPPSLRSIVGGTQGDHTPESKIASETKKALDKQLQKQAPSLNDVAASSPQFGTIEGADGSTSSVVRNADGSHTFTDREGNTRNTPAFTPTSTAELADRATRNAILSGETNAPADAYTAATAAAQTKAATAKQGRIEKQATTFLSKFKDTPLMAKAEDFINVYQNSGYNMKNANGLFNASNIIQTNANKSGDLFNTPELLEIFGNDDDSPGLLSSRLQSITENGGGDLVIHYLDAAGDPLSYDVDKDWFADSPEAYDALISLASGDL